MEITKNKIFRQIFPIPQNWKEIQVQDVLEKKHSTPVIFSTQPSNNELGLGVSMCVCVFMFERPLLNPKERREQK